MLEPLDPFEPKKSFLSPSVSRKTQESKEGWSEGVLRRSNRSDNSQPVMGDHGHIAKKDSGIDMDELHKAQGYFPTSFSI